MCFIESRSLQSQNQCLFYQIRRNRSKQKLTLQIIRSEGSLASATKTGSCTLQRFSPRSLVVSILYAGMPICRQFPSWATGQLDCTHWSPGPYAGLAYMLGIPRHALSGTTCPGPAYPARAHIYLGFAFAVHLALNNNQQTSTSFSLLFLFCVAQQSSLTTLFITRNFLPLSKLSRSRGYTLAVQSSLSKYIPIIKTYDTSLLRRNLVGARFIRQSSYWSSILRSTIRRGIRTYIQTPLADGQTILRNIRLQALRYRYFGQRPIERLNTTPSWQTTLSIY